MDLDADCSQDKQTKAVSWVFDSHFLCDFLQDRCCICLLVLLVVVLETEPRTHCMLCYAGSSYSPTPTHMGYLLNPD